MSASEEASAVLGARPCSRKVGSARPQPLPGPGSPPPQGSQVSLNTPGLSMWSVGDKCLYREKHGSPHTPVLLRVRPPRVCSEFSFLNPESSVCSRNPRGWRAGISPSLTSLFSSVEAEVAPVPLGGRQGRVSQEDPGGRRGQHRPLPSGGRPGWGPARPPRVIPSGSFPAPFSLPAHGRVSQSFLQRRFGDFVLDTCHYRPSKAVKFRPSPARVGSSFFASFPF